MPSAPPKPSMSLGELAICEDFLDSHREYAIDLFSNVEKIRQWHGTDSCPETREGRTCTVCELCSADGLLGATKKALASYNDAEKHLQEVRASLGKSAISRGASNRETLFKSHLAKTVFLCIVTVGDTLRSQHAAWQARLQSELVTSPSSVQSPQHSNTGPGGLDTSGDGDGDGDILLPTYSGPRFVGPETNPKLAAAPTGWVPETTSSSSTATFVVFRRCLSSDCPCEAKKARAASNTSLGGPLPSDSKKTRTSKATAKLEAATRGGSTRSTTTNLEHRSKGPSDTSDALAKTRMNAQIQKESTYDDTNSPDARAFNAQRPQDVVPGEHAPSDSDPRLETGLLTHETEAAAASPLPELIVDPRVFHLRVQIVRSDDARRALMEWCRTWMADLQSNPQERHVTGSEASLTHRSTMKDARGYPSALACGFEAVEPGKSLRMTGRVGEAATNGLSRGDDETMAQEQRFNSEQEELKRRWLMARKKQCKDRKRRPALV